MEILIVLRLSDAAVSRKLKSLIVLRLFDVSVSRKLRRMIVLGLFDVALSRKSKVLAVLELFDVFVTHQLKNGFEKRRASGLEKFTWMVLILRAKPQIFGVGIVSTF